MKILGGEGGGSINSHFQRGSAERLKLLGGEGGEEGQTTVNSENPKEIYNINNGFSNKFQLFRRISVASCMLVKNNF